MQDAQPFRAAIWMTGSILGFSAIAIAGREIGTALDTFEVMIYRSAIGIATVLAVAQIAGTRGKISLAHMPLHLLRNGFHFAGQNLWLYALLYIPMAQLFALEFSYPILVALAAPLFLGERLTGTRIAATFLGFAGILIVAQPWAEGGLSLGLFAALGSAVGFAVSAIVTKKLTRVVPITAILFWLTTIQFLLGFGIAAADGQIALPHGINIGWVLVMGFGGLGAHFCLTRALSLAPATIVTPIDFLRLPLIGIVAALAYGEALNLWIFAGGAVILAANMLNLAPERGGKDRTIRVAPGGPPR